MKAATQVLQMETSMPFTLVIVSFVLVYMIHGIKYSVVHSIHN